MPSSGRVLASTPEFALHCLGAVGSPVPAFLPTCSCLEKKTTSGNLLSPEYRNLPKRLPDVRRQAEVSMPGAYNSSCVRLSADRQLRLLPSIALPTTQSPSSLLAGRHKSACRGNASPDSAQPI